MSTDPQTVSIVDAGTANVGSVLRMVEKAGGRAARATTAADVDAAGKIILPGVGAFDHGMRQLASLGLIDALTRAAVERRIPVLGICLGMQLMCRGSEEGNLPGLGWMDADVLKFRFDDATKLPVPHMGWNTLHVKRDSRLVRTTLPRTRYYFVHSYHVACRVTEDIVATTNYGVDFVSVFAKGNVFGAQFHPEKSHRFGMEFLRNFLEIGLD